MTLCKQKGRYSNHVVYSADDMKCFIKYNNATMNEAHSQLFFYNQMKQKSNATIRIPQIYHAFETENGGKAYIVMEHIEIDVERPASDEQRAQAISELISVPPPHRIFGSFTGSRFQHHFFRDSEPPVLFASAEELEAYVNRVSSLLFANCFFITRNSNHPPNAREFERLLTGSTPKSLAGKIK